MSGQSSSEKTEEPTPKKLRDLRKKGQVPMCKELVSTSMIICMFSYLLFAGPALFDRIAQMSLAPAIFYNQPFEEASKRVFDLLIKEFLLVVAPLVLIIVCVSFLANVLQNGIVTSVEPLKPNLSKISPIGGFKKIFSMNNFVEFLKSIIKVTTVSACVYLVVSSNLSSAINSPSCDLDCVTAALIDMLLELIVYSASVFIVVAGADLIFQRHSFIKKNRMTKDEVKRDHKESDGDPVIKGRRKQLQRQIAEGKQMQTVKRASVVVKNPTHYAVAIRYDAKETPLPYVMLKGENRLALEIVRIAEEHGIPVLENVPLARGLYGQVPVDTFIPIDFIPAVVEVLHWVKKHHPEFRHAE